MADLSAVIETLEHQLMRAWMRGDDKEMKSLVARNFMMIVGGKRSLLLDRPSWVDAAGCRFRLEGYRLGEVYVRKTGGVVLFAVRAELEMNLSGKAWTGDFWLVDLWQKSTVLRRWNLVKRSLSRPDSDKDIPAIIRSLQLWR